MRRKAEGEMVQTEYSTKLDSMAVLTILAVTRGPAKEIEADRRARPFGPVEAPFFSFACSLLFNHPFFLSRLWFHLLERVFDLICVKIDSFTNHVFAI